MGLAADRRPERCFPAELLAFYGRHFPDRDMLVRVGGGVTCHFGGGVTGSGSLSGVEMSTDDALGGTAEVSVIYGILSGGLR